MGKLTPALLQIYGCLSKTFGPQHWWPAKSPFEVMAGAVLTQSAAWSNVEKALRNLKNAGALSPEAIRALPQDTLAQLVRPSGYYNAKAKKLKALTEWLGGYGDSLDKAFGGDTEKIRIALLEVHGIGPETADSILLYAAGRPVFVIDAYTRRAISRLGLASGDESYDALQRLFAANLPADAALFNEYHALLVRLAKESCRKQPLCGDCCLKEICRGRTG
jgi:endonuclease III related protein